MADGDEMPDWKRLAQPAAARVMAPRCPAPRTDQQLAPRDQHLVPKESPPTPCRPAAEHAAAPPMLPLSAVARPPPAVAPRPKVARVLAARSPLPSPAQPDALRRGLTVQPRPFQALAARPRLWGTRPIVVQRPPARAEAVVLLRPAPARVPAWVPAPDAGDARGEALSRQILELIEATKRADVKLQGDATPPALPPLQHIGHGKAPHCMEDAFILDRQQQRAELFEPQGHLGDQGFHAAQPVPAGCLGVGWSEACAAPVQHQAYQLALIGAAGAPPPSALQMIPLQAGVAAPCLIPVDGVQPESADLTPCGQTLAFGGAPLEILAEPSLGVEAGDDPLEPLGIDGDGGSVSEGAQKRRRTAGPGEAACMEQVAQDPY